MGSVVEKAYCDKTVSDILLENLNEFVKGRKVYISAPTGSGKTYGLNKLIKQYALNNNVRILYCCNRSTLMDQQICELGKVDVIYTKSEEVVSFQNNQLPNVIVTTYQAIENACAMEFIDFDYFDLFDIIVLDEIHYLLSDSTFNTRTMIIFEMIKKSYLSLQFLVSATGDDIFNLIENNLKEESVASNLYLKLYKNQNYKGQNFCFNNIDMVIEKIKGNRNEKWLFFVDKKTKGHEIQKKLKEEGISVEYIDATCTAKTVYKEIVTKSQFQSQVLIATSVIDNGVHIKDPNVKNIVLFSNYKKELIQMYGRKRYSSNDVFNVYINDTSKEEILKMIEKLEEKIKLIESWKNQFYRFRNKVLPIYDDNSQMGNEYRNYFVRIGNCFMFNDLGLYQNYSLLNNLKELYGSNDSCLKKLEWIRQPYFYRLRYKFLYPEIKKIDLKYINIHDTSFDKIYLKYRDRIIDEIEYNELCKEINIYFREKNKKDRKFRDDKIAKKTVINNAFFRYSLPYIIEKSQEGYQIKNIK